eukprot:436546_1
MTHNWEAFIGLTTFQILLFCYWISKLYLCTCPTHNELSKTNTSQTSSTSTNATSNTSGSISSINISSISITSMNNNNNIDTNNNTDNKIKNVEETINNTIEMKIHPTVHSKQSKMSTKHTTFKASLDNKILSNKLCKLLSTLSILFSVINLSISAVMWRLNDTEISDQQLQLSRSDCIISTINFAISILSRYFLYICYLQRIKTIFNKTLWNINMKRFKMLLYIITCGHLISVLMYIFIYTVNACDLNNFLLAVSWPLLNDIITSIFCLVYFIYKLRVLNNHISNDTKIKQIVSPKMKYIVKKLVILTFITVVTSFIAVIMTSFGYFTIIAINESVNNICLILSFGFTDYYFRKICCVFLICL